MAGLRIAIVLHDGMTALDAVGPQQVLRFLPGARVELVAEAAGRRAGRPAGAVVATGAPGDDLDDVGLLGVAGIDMALVLAERLSDRTTAEAIQLVIEYDPQPPHDAGALAKVGPDVVSRAVELGRPHRAMPEFWEPPEPAR